MNRNITALILIVLAIGIYFTFTQSQIDTIQVEQATNAKYLEAITNAETLVAQRKKISEDYSNISPAEKDRLERIVPSSTNNIHLIVDLNELALTVHHIQLKDIKAEAINQPQTASLTVVSDASQATSTAVLSQVKISFTAVASYQQFTNFMRDVQGSLRILDISHLTVKASDTGAYTFQVELKAYWLKS